jgi:hypothetical protein
MPVIIRGPVTSRPLPPEGPAKLFIEDIGVGKSTNKQTPFFELNVRDLASGITFKLRLYLTAGSAWKMDACCRSAGLILPANNSPYRVTTDDLEHRICYAPLIQKQTEQGRQVVEASSFWTSQYAFKQAPQLEHIPDPPGVILTPKELPAEASVLPPLSPPLPPAAAPPAPAMAPVAAPSPAPVSTNPLDELTEDQLAAAMAYARSLRPIPNEVTR